MKREEGAHARLMVGCCCCWSCRGRPAVGWRSAVLGQGEGSAQGRAGACAALDMQAQIRGGRSCLGKLGLDYRGGRWSCWFCHLLVSCCGAAAAAALAAVRQGAGGQGGGGREEEIRPSKGSSGWWLSKEGGGTAGLGACCCCRRSGRGGNNRWR